MPDGVVQWVDPASGEAAIVRGGRRFAAAISDLEPVARHPGAHVHFDIDRRDGVDRAVGVTLRAGTRVSHHQHRFGTLTGARRLDTKGAAPFARPHPERGRALAVRPLQVVRAWAECLEERDLDGALSLYAPDAVVHAGGDELAGRGRIASYLEASGLVGISRDADVRGEDGTFVVRWPEPDGDTGVEVRSRIEHGLIAEQWLAPMAPAARTITAAGRSVAIATHGVVDAADVDYAIGRLTAVLEHIGAPVLFARLKLSQATDPARTRPAMVQVSVDVDGDIVRAHVAGHSMREAADLLQRRLRDKLEQRAQHQDALRTRRGMPDVGEWRHGDLPTSRPEYFDRPVDERELVRHKAFAVGELTPDEAAFDMDQLDYDFHLFRDLATGEDALMERRPDGSRRLTRLHPSTVGTGPVAVPLMVEERPPPELAVHDALERLDAGGEPFVFFADTDTGRGNVAYRRYDGHYGLITAA